LLLAASSLLHYMVDRCVSQLLIHDHLEAIIP